MSRRKADEIWDKFTPEEMKRGCKITLPFNSGSMNGLYAAVQKERLSFSKKTKEAFSRIFDAAWIGRNPGGGKLNVEVSDNEILLQLFNYPYAAGFADGLSHGIVGERAKAIYFGSQGGRNKTDLTEHTLLQSEIDRKYAEWQAAHEAGLTDEPWRYGQACLELSEETGIPACTIRNNAQNPEYRPRKRKK